jgi:RNA polymerase sigma-70 factor, ECF subfamily
MDTNPETSVNRAQLRTLLEDAILELPPTFRVVFMLREVEGLSVQEVATHLEIPLATVKTRAYRARQMLQRLLTDRVGGMFGELFAFLGTDCDGLTQSVLRRLRH